MKILCIKLQNLNSLREEHEVNFETEPLASSGLFAITGLTGAGKSTILDAITLALYGHAARYGNTPNPEDMMSRHCGECRAEVEFLVPRGRFRAEWHLWRAKKKSSGKIQSPKRYVYDAGGRVLASSISEAERLIQELVGLDYHRFLRSVLLAQGEFARFLKANPNERAELLESLTGTEIYSELGQLAFSEASRREAEVAQEQAQIGMIVLLSDEQRKQIQQEIKDSDLALIQCKGEIQELDKELRRAQDLRKALKDESSVLERQKDLAVEQEAAGSALKQFERHRLARPYFDDLGQLEAAMAQAQDREVKLKIAEEQNRKRHRAWMTALAAVADFADHLVMFEKQAITKDREVIKKQEAQRQETARWLTEHAEDRDLEAQLPELSTQLGQLESFRKEIAVTDKKSGKLQQQVLEQKAAVSNAESALKEAETAFKARESEKLAANGALEKVLQGKSEEIREQEIQNLQTQVEAIEKLLEIDNTCQVYQADLVTNGKKLAALKTELEKAQALVVQLGTHKDEAAKIVLFHQDHLLKATRVASFEEHRSILKPGEACPLCGATDHPFAQGGVQGLSIATIEHQIDVAKKKQAEVEAALRAAETTLTHHITTQSNLTATVRKTELDLGKQLQRMKVIATENNLPNADSTGLDLLKKEKSSLINQLQKELVLIKKARASVSTAETARLQAENDKNLASATKANAENTLKSLETQIQDEKLRLADFQEKLTTTTQHLEELLLPFKVPLPEPSQEQWARKQLTTRKVDYQARTTALTGLTGSLDKARAALQGKMDMLAPLEGKALDLQARKAAHTTDLKFVDPAECLQLRVSWQSLKEAEKALSAFEKECTDAAATLNIWKEDAKLASEKVANLRAILTAKLGTSAFATVEELQAAKLDPVKASQIEKLGKDLKSKADILQGELDQVQKTIILLREAKAAEGEAVKVLEDNKAVKERAAYDLAKKIGQRDHDLKTDDSNQSQHKVRVEALEQRRNQLQIWKLLQGLIGSSDGAKFRRYAQRLSLEVLVCHANRHLKRLSDRYQMQAHKGEELELQIEDLYQAGVTRPMASLSGGESFLASLALALGLADLAGRSVRIDSLFIDEGFGALDSDTLDLAISSLETLRQDNKTVGVISHVELLKERIATQIIVEKGSGGVSSIRIAT